MSLYPYHSQLQHHTGAHSIQLIDCGCSLPGWIHCQHIEIPLIRQEWFPVQNWHLNNLLWLYNYRTTEKLKQILLIVLYLQILLLTHTGRIEAQFIADHHGFLLTPALAADRPPISINTHLHSPCSNGSGICSWVT